MLGRAVRVRESGDVGRIIVEDAEDYFPYKVSFGQGRPADWFRDQALEFLTEQQVPVGCELPCVDLADASAEANKLLERRDARKVVPRSDSSAVHVSAQVPDNSLPDVGFNSGCYSNGYWVQGCLAPWHPTDDDRLHEALTSLKLHAGDLLLELGCGDGKICRAAAEHFGCRSVGIELDQAMVQRARENMNTLPDHCRNLVEIRHGDLLKMQLSEKPTCVTMYLMPEHYERLEPLLDRFICDGARVVAFAFRLPSQRWESRMVQQGAGWWIYEEAVRRPSGP